MALNSQQINQLLNEARAAGFDTAEVRAIEWMLLDRAAQMDGATRLEMAAQLLPDEDRVPLDTYMSEAATLRTDVIKRGVADLKSLSDEEWERLVNGS